MPRLLTLPSMQRLPAIWCSRTFHTETAAAAVPRLLDLGVENFSAAIDFACCHCATTSPNPLRALQDRADTSPRILAADPRYTSAFARNRPPAYTSPVGCERCSGTGYRGRTGVFEILEVTEEVRALSVNAPIPGTITRAATDAGMTTMFEHAVVKCLSGITS